MYRIALILLLVLSSIVLVAQERMSFNGLPISTKLKAGFEQELKAFQLFKINSKALSEYLDNGKSNQAIQLELGTAYDWKMEIYPHDIRTSNYQLYTAGAKGIELLPATKNKTFRGYLQTDAEQVRLTVEQGFIYGYVEQGKERYFIEPARTFEPSLDQDIFVVYKEKRCDSGRRSNLCCARIS